MEDAVAGLKRINLACDGSCNFLLQWLRDRQYWYPVKDAFKEKLASEGITYRPEEWLELISLYSGIAEIPASELRTVIKLMAKDFLAESDTFWSQTGNEHQGMKMVVDIDCKRILTPSEVLVIYRTFQTTLSIYFQNWAQDPIDIYCATSSKTDPLVSATGKKFNIHLLAAVKVTVPEARQIVKGFHARLLELSFNFKDVEIDDAIYRGHSCTMRAIYSAKKKVCVSCKGDDYSKPNCTLCMGVGFLCTKNNYRPSLKLLHDGTVDEKHFKEHHADVLQVFENYSLWALDERYQRTDFKVPLSEPLVESLCETLFSTTTTATKGGAVAQAGSTSVDKPLKTLLKNRKGNVLNPDLGYHRFIQESIRGWTWQGMQPWNRIIVNEVLVNTVTALITVNSFGHSYCLYAKRDHGQSIYFQLRRNTGVLSQHCFSVKHGCVEKCKKREPEISIQLPLPTVQKLFDAAGVMGQKSVLGFGAVEIKAQPHTSGVARRTDRLISDRSKRQKLAEERGSQEEEEERGDRILRTISRTFGTSLLEDGLSSHCFGKPTSSTISTSSTGTAGTTDGPNASFQDFLNQIQI